MRKGRDGEKKTGGEKTGKKENTDENSGHYVIASSRTPERRPLELRTLVPKFHFLLNPSVKTQYTYLRYTRSATTRTKFAFLRTNKPTSLLTVGFCTQFSAFFVLLSITNSRTLGFNTLKVRNVII